jgi:hypothetical protein
MCGFAKRPEWLELPMALAYADALTFVQSLAPTWVKPQQAMLAQLVCGLAERPTLCPAELARSLPDGPHSRPCRDCPGRLKRLNRFLDNPRLDEAQLFFRWYRLAVHFAQGVPSAARLLPALRDTTYFEPYAALIASIPCGGRALPIAFTSYHRHILQACFPARERWPDPDTPAVHPARRQHQPLRAASAERHFFASQNEIEQTLLSYLWAFVTPTQQVVIVADRGFARASRFRTLSAHRFVIRFDADTWLYLPDGRSGPARAVVPLVPGRRCWLPQARYAKDEQVPLAVLGVWEKGQKEPWYLATNLESEQATETCSRLRMRMEAGNRDQKTGALLRQGGDHHQLTSLLHLHRLLLANFTLHWLAALAGLQADHDLADPGAVAPALEQSSPACPDLALRAVGPAEPPPPEPHRGPQLPLSSFFHLSR